MDHFLLPRRRCCLRGCRGLDWKVVSVRVKFLVVLQQWQVVLAGEGVFLWVLGFAVKVVAVCVQCLEFLQERGAVLVQGEIVREIVVVCVQWLVFLQRREVDSVGGMFVRRAVVHVEVRRFVVSVGAHPFPAPPQGHRLSADLLHGNSNVDSPVPILAWLHPTHLCRLFAVPIVIRHLAVGLVVMVAKESSLLVIFWNSLLALVFLVVLPLWVSAFLGLLTFFRPLVRQLSA